MTLSQCLDECQRMWWFVSRSNLAVPKAKHEWCKKNGYNIKNSCFFCQFAVNRREENYCIECAGKQIEPGWSCFEPEFHYALYPKKFYKEVKRLNKLHKQKEKNNEKT